MEGITLPTEAEIKEAAAAYHKNLAWAQSLSEEQINFLCDGGWYNDTIKGYLMIAAKNAGMNAEQTQELLDGLRWAMSENNKEEAAKVYQNRHN